MGGVNVIMALKQISKLVHDRVQQPILVLAMVAFEL
jgi:hypothetical protein